MWNNWKFINEWPAVIKFSKFVVKPVLKKIAKEIQRVSLIKASVEATGRNMFNQKKTSIFMNN